METTFDYTSKDKAYFTSDERKWINKIRSYAKVYPDLVTITHEPETNDGCLCAEIPTEWLRVSPPRKISLSEEERAKRSEKLRLAREKLKNGKA